MDAETEALIKSIKERVADVIINFNLIESRISDILSKYIDSPKDDFIRKVLLNSLIVNFSSKFNVLKYILKSEKIEVSKDFYNAIKVVMTKRNILAHSGSLLDLGTDLIDVEFDWDRDTGAVPYPIFASEEPYLAMVNDGDINYENISKIIEDFSKYFDITMKGLDIIEHHFAS